MQTCICKAIDDTGLQGIYKLPHSWVIVWTTVQTNNTKCVLKGLRVSTVKTCTFQHSPHILDSTNICNPPTLWWNQFLEGRFTILKKIQLFIPILALVQWPIWGLLSLSGLRNALPAAVRFTLLKLSNSLSTSSTNSHRQVLSAEHPYKKHKHWTVPLVSLSLLANLKNIFKTRYQITIE